MLLLRWSIKPKYNLKGQSYIDERKFVGAPNNDIIAHPLTTKPFSEQAFDIDLFSIELPGRLLQDNY